MKVSATSPGCGLIIFKALVVVLLTFIEVQFFTWLFGAPATWWDVLLLVMLNFAVVKVEVS